LAIAIAEACSVACLFCSSTSGATGGFEVNISLDMVVNGTAPPSEVTFVRFLFFDADVAALRAFAVAFASSGYLATKAEGIGVDSALFLLVDMAPVAAMSEP
jgi:hypothetical protein